MTGDGDLRGGYLSGSPEPRCGCRIVVDMTNDFATLTGSMRGTADCARAARSCQHRRGHGCGAPAGQLVVLCSQFIFRRGGNAVACLVWWRRGPWLAAEGWPPAGGTSPIPLTPDFTIDKPRASGSFATSLDLLLRGLGVDTVILLGSYTNQCIEATARDAWASTKIGLPPDGTPASIRRCTRPR